MRQEADQVAHLNADGSIRHPDRVVAAEWRDPADARALERGPDGKRHQQTVRGYRVADPLLRLPCGPDHHRAARRLRSIHDVAEGVRIGDVTQDRVDGGSAAGFDPSGDQLDAIEERRRVYEALGVRACAVVLPVVLAGWTVADLVTRVGGNAMAMQGRVMAALDRLAEHLCPKREVATVAVPAFTDRHDTGLPVERLGRV